MSALDVVARARNERFTDLAGNACLLDLKPGLSPVQLDEIGRRLAGSPSDRDS